MLFISFVIFTLLIVSDEHDIRSVTEYVCTGWSKNPDTQFYFWDNFGNSAQILTILSLLQAEMYGA